MKNYLSGWQKHGGALRDHKNSICRNHHANAAFWPNSARSCSLRTSARPRTSTLISTLASLRPEASDSPSQPASTGAASRRTVLHVGALYALAQRWIPSADAAEIASQSATAASTESLAQQLDRRVVEFTLPNGMRFLCAERRTAPIVSFHTYADVGAFDERAGLTGIAHLLEHMAFKGTPRIGTVNFQQENELLLAMDEVFYSLISAGNSREAAALQRQLDSLLAAASELQVPNAYGALLQREGAVGLNAATTHDSTTYVCSLPSNKLELWFALEAERFQLPVFRELYSEKKVVFEERRMRVENAPLGRFQERFAAVSLTNNYRRPVIGYPEDLERMGRREVAQFFAEQYGPEKLTVAVVGDASPERVRQLAEKYFGGWKSSSSRAHSARSGSGINPGQESLPRPEGSATDRALVYQSRAGPAVLRAWYRPGVKDAEASTALDAVNDVLTGGRSARLYNRLVQTGQALACTSFATYPADKHACQMAAYVIPAPGRSIENVDELLRREVALLACDGPTERELHRYAAAARTGALNVLQSNSAMAAALATYEVMSGGWRDITGELYRIESLTPSGVADVAGKYLHDDNSFVGYVQAT